MGTSNIYVDAVTATYDESIVKLDCKFSFILERISEPVNDALDVFLN